VHGLGLVAVGGARRPYVSSWPVGDKKVSFESKEYLTYLQLTFSTMAAAALSRKDVGGCTYARGGSIELFASFYRYTAFKEPLLALEGSYLMAISLGAFFANPNPPKASSSESPPLQLSSSSWLLLVSVPRCCSWPFLPARKLIATDSQTYFRLVAEILLKCHAPVHETLSLSALLGLPELSAL
jgi:hypothetical protein